MSNKTEEKVLYLVDANNEYNTLEETLETLKSSFDSKICYQCGKPVSWTKNGGSWKIFETEEKRYRYITEKRLEELDKETFDHRCINHPDKLTKKQFFLHVSACVGILWVAYWIVVSIFNWIF
jgi:hypothetical protein